MAVHRVGASHVHAGFSSTECAPRDAVPGVVEAPEGPAEPLHTLEQVFLWHKDVVHNNLPLTFAGDREDAHSVNVSTNKGARGTTEGARQREVEPATVGEPAAATERDSQ